jgi:hypothetical protein
MCVGSYMYGCAAVWVRKRYDEVGAVRGAAARAARPGGTQLTARLPHAASKRGVGAVADALAKRGAGLSPRPELTFRWNL